MSAKCQQRTFSDHAHSIADIHLIWIKSAVVGVIKSGAQAIVRDQQSLDATKVLQIGDMIVLVLGNRYDTGSTCGRHSTVSTVSYRLHGRRARLLYGDPVLVGQRISAIGFIGVEAGGNRTRKVTQFNACAAPPSCGVFPAPPLLSRKSWENVEISCAFSPLYARRRCLV